MGKSYTRTFGSSSAARRSPKAGVLLHASGSGSVLGTTDIGTVHLGNISFSFISANYFTQTLKNLVYFLSGDARFCRSLVVIDIAISIFIFTHMCTLECMWYPSVLFCTL